MGKLRCFPRVVWHSYGKWSIYMYYIWMVFLKNRLWGYLKLGGTSRWFLLTMDTKYNWEWVPHSEIYILWLFSIAMENGIFNLMIYVSWWFTCYFPFVMANNQKVHVFIGNVSGLKPPLSNWQLKQAFWLACICGTWHHVWKCLYRYFLWDTYCVVVFQLIHPHH